MPARRLGRFLLEVAFLAAVAAGVTVARLHPAPVIAMMALAWIIVALLEWVAWRDVPHYGRGLPPRYYVPQVALPPPRAVEQRAYRYPAPVEEEATWIAPAGNWGETLDWPAGSSAVDETQVVDGGPVEPGLVEPGLVEPGVGDAGELEEPVPTVHGGLAYTGTQEPVGWDESDLELEEVELEAVLEPEPGLPVRVSGAAPAVAAEYSPVELRVPERVERAALHHVDPPDAPARRRWFRRSEEGQVIEVRDGPPPGRLLPGAVRSDLTSPGP